MSRRQCKHCPWRVDRPSRHPERLLRRQARESAQHDREVWRPAARRPAADDGLPRIEAWQGAALRRLARAPARARQQSRAAHARDERSIADDFKLVGEQHERFEDTLPEES